MKRARIAKTADTTDQSDPPDTGQAGANLVYESAGMLGSLLACSLEALVIDNDMLGSVNRTVRGIDITEESLSAQVIKDTITGAGHFPGHISSEQDEWIRANYPIALPVEEVRGDGGC